MSVSSILKRWDAIAHAQLTEAAARLVAENDALSERAYRAENDAEAWRDNWLNAIESAGMEPGITMDGHAIGVSRG